MSNKEMIFTLDDGSFWKRIGILDSIEKAEESSEQEEMVKQDMRKRENDSET